MNIKELSEIMGFSQATISNALNNKKGVNKETAEQIIRAAKEYGYLTEARIANIKLVIYKNDGQIVTDTPFFSSLIEGVETEARNFGYETTIFNLNRNDPDYDARLQQLINDNSSAILLLATEMMEEDAKSFENALSPVVILDNWFESMSLDAVLINNTDSVCHAVERLIADGHKEIGYLKGAVRIKNFFYRQIGYERALQRHGIKVNPNYDFLLTPTMEGAFKDMQKFLSKNPQLPTAFFADNDIIALGAMKALINHGIKVPEDVSIVGFDDMPFCAISSPSLTTIRVFKQEMGQTAVRRLVEICKTPCQIKTKTQISTELIERDSVRKISNCK